MLLLLGRGAWAVGFGVGAAVSLGSFQLIARAVGRLTEPGVTRQAGLLWKGALIRFAIVGAVLFLALIVLRVALLALLAGLLLTHATMIGHWLVYSLRAKT